MKKQNLWNVVIPMLAIATNAFAAETSVSEAISLSPRSNKKLGVYLGVGEPAPGVLGVNVAYNLNDFLRAQVGFGQVSATTGLSMTNNSISTTESSITTIGAGVRAFVPGWRLSPTAGFHYGMVSYSGDGMEVNGFSKSGGHVYGSFGLDYQATSGLNLGAGRTQSFKSGVGSDIYLNAGWFFDFFG